MQGIDLYQQYKNQAVSSLTKEELLIELFSETIKQIHMAMNALEKKNFESVNNSLKKSTTILSTLNYYLDPKYDISKQLRPLYDFMISELVTGNMKKDRKIIEDVLFLVTELKDAFSQAYKILKTKTASPSKLGGVY